MEESVKRYRAALYMRLSKEDEGNGESSSITTQRKMLRAFAHENISQFMMNILMTAYQEPPLNALNLYG